MLPRATDGAVVASPEHAKDPGDILTVSLPLSSLKCEPVVGSPTWPEIVQPRSFSRACDKFVGWD